jgi:putative tryptophan/tyrosine transport system substrate-binding protein
MTTKTTVACLALAVALTFALAGIGGAQSSAQTAKTYRIGFLSIGDFAPGSPSRGFADGIVAGLGQHGYKVGANLVVEERSAQTHKERLPALASELIERNVDVIAINNYPAAAAAKQATSTVPIVISGGGDPVRTNLIASLAHPGGNITGVSDVAVQLAPKRLGYLREAVPGIKRVAMLWNADDPGMTLRYQAAADVAKGLGITVQPLGVREPDDFDVAFKTMIAEPPDGILMVADALTFLNRRHVYEFAQAHRLPAIYEVEPFVRDGGLMSYGPDPKETAERAAYLIDRIFKGAKPIDLPFEQPTRFRLVINLKAAQAIGLTLPPTLLAEADQIIE